jgi:hypothetical protein
VREQLYVYNSPMQIAVAQRTDRVDGGDVLPGFSLPLEALFVTDDKPE